MFVSVQFRQTSIHPYRLINLLPEVLGGWGVGGVKGRLKRSWSSVKTFYCNTDYVRFIPFVRTCHQLIFNSTSV